MEESAQGPEKRKRQRIHIIDKNLAVENVYRLFRWVTNNQKGDDSITGKMQNCLYDGYAKRPEMQKKLLQEQYKEYFEKYLCDCTGKSDTQIHAESIKFVNQICAEQLTPDFCRFILSCAWEISKANKETFSTTQNIAQDSSKGIVIRPGYTTGANAKKIRSIIRSLFTKYDNGKTVRENNGSKENFLQMIGILSRAGDSSLKKMGTEQYFTQFKEFVTGLGKDYSVAKMLGVSEYDENAQRRAFVSKAESTYIQICAGFLQEASKKDANLVPIRIENIIKGINGPNGYIDGLFLGKQDVQSTHVDVDCLRHEDYKGILIGDQHSNVDHKIQISYALGLYERICGHQLYVERMDDNELKILAQKISPLVNNIGNHRLVIGGELNDKLENEKLDIHQNYLLKREKDESIIVTSYNPSEIKKLFENSGMSKEIIANYVRALDKYSTPDNKGCITTKLNIVEPKSVSNLREYREEGPSRSMVYSNGR